MKPHLFFLSLLCLVGPLLPAAAMEIPANFKRGGFAVGCQAYTFRNFTAIEAIEKTAQAGGRVIEFYPGQSFSPEKPELRWNHDATDEMIAEIEEQLERFNVKAINYGVVGIPTNEEEARKIFEFAKRLGIQGITTESENSLDTIEKLVKEFDIEIAFHNHPRRSDNPDYKMWDPNHVKNLLQDRDKRIGACADTGHWMRSGLDPVESLRILEGRIVSLHLKDRLDPEHGHDVILGTGAGKIPEVLEELRKQNFSGNISVEYEYNWDDSVPDVAQSIGFIDGYGTARGWQ